MRKKIFVGLVVVALFAVFLITMSCGRTTSRYAGKDFRQVLEVSNMEKFISISYDKNGSSTVKDVTFLAKDGYVYTQEFKDVSPLEGVIRWVPSNESSSIIQSRAISRWIGTPVNLKLPEDCVQVLGVDIGFEAEDERVKNLTYQAKDGRILSKEYREGLIDRSFGGWLEIKKAS